MDRGLATGLHVQQLQKLLQTYFGAMRHCLVCSSTVGATNLAACWNSTRIQVWTTEDGGQIDTGTAKRGGLKRITSFIIDQGIDDSRLDLAS